MPVVAVLATAAVPVLAADALLCLAVSFSYLQRTHRLMQNGWPAAGHGFGHMSAPVLQSLLKVCFTLPHAVDRSFTTYEGTRLYKWVKALVTWAGEAVRRCSTTWYQRL